MELLVSVIGLIGVGLGWFLTQLGDYFNDKKSDKKKLNKLLFFLLELRFLLWKELSFDNELKDAISILKSKIETFIGESLDELELEVALISQLKANYDQSETIVLLEENIDDIITDLSEVYPIFAYELNGQYKIKEKLVHAKNNIEEIKIIQPDIPNEITNAINNSLSSTDLIKQLDEHIKKIGRKIGRKTTKDIKLILSKEKNYDVDGLSQFMDKFLQEIVKQFKNSYE